MFLQIFLESSGCMAHIFDHINPFSPVVYWLHLCHENLEICLKLSFCVKLSFIIGDYKLLLSRSISLTRDWIFLISTETGPSISSGSENYDSLLLL